MYTLQHRETGSHWAEVENYSRRNSLCSYLNKPQIVLCVVPKCRSVHEQWCLRSCRSRALTGAVPALHWAPGAAQGGIRVLRRFLHQSWSPRLSGGSADKSPVNGRSGPRQAAVWSIGSAVGVMDFLQQREQRGHIHPWGSTAGRLTRASALERGCNTAVALASINPHL